MSDSKSFYALLPRPMACSAMGSPETVAMDNQTLQPETLNPETLAPETLSPEMLRGRQLS